MHPVSRAARVLAGLTIIAITFGVILRAHLGLGPLHVLQQAIGRHAGITIGQAGIALNASLFLLALLLRERPGIATLGSVVLGGLLIDLFLPHIPTPHAIALRLLFVTGGILVMAFGGALYMSADLGASPYDAVMTAVFRQVRHSLYAVRLTMEAIACLLGWLAGGEVGVGSVIVGLVVGPALQLWLRVLRATPEKRAGFVEEPVATPALTAASSR